MTLMRCNYVLAVLVLVLLALTAVLNTDRTRPNYETMPNMKYSPAYKAFAENPNFADRRTLRLPVEGTVSRKQLWLDYAGTPEDAIRAGEELSNPIARDAEQYQASIALGAETYGIYCTVCHGSSGAGDGAVAKRGFPPPPSLTTGNSLKMKDGQLFHILTYGQGSMPAFAAQLTPVDRWNVINFVRSMQPVSQELDDTSPDDSPPEEEQTEKSPQGAGA